MFKNRTFELGGDTVRFGLQYMLTRATVSLLAIVLVCSTAVGQSERRDGALIGQPDTPIKSWDIDKVWTGVPVDYAAVRSGDEVVAGYYDQNRRVTLTVLPLKGGATTHIHLPDTYKGWDGHNYVALAVDRSGTIHVAANMHDDPLKYYQLPKPYAEGKAKVAPMIGADESSVTYPKFYHTADGDLIFGYREGKTGDGIWLFNRWTGTSWARILPGPTFSERHEGNPVNAYPRVVKDARGTFHFALQWRKPGGLAENFRITYASTRDFVRWNRLDGSAIDLPITPDNSSLIVDTGTEMGLRSGPISIDEAGRPIISFTRYAADGPNAGYVARGDTTGWLVQEVARTDRRWVMEGKGILARGIAVGSKAVVIRDGVPIACFRIQNRGLECKMLDAKTLKPSGAANLETDGRARAAADSTAGLADPSVHEVPVLDGLGRETIASLVWPSQSSRRWRCTRETPNACNPPAKTLRLVAPTAWGAGGQ